MHTIEPDFRRLLVHSLWAIAICLVVVVFCYEWIDRAVAIYVHGHEIAKLPWIKQLTYPPPVVQNWSPLVLVVLMIRRAWGPLSGCQKTLFVACLALVIANQFRVSLGGVCGRYWPETWFHIDPANLPGGTLGNDLLQAGKGEYLNNPSLIGDGTYGFHPFSWSDDLGSFPSGHATRLLSIATVFWIAMPRSRVFFLLVCPPMLASLVAMNYHFVSDVVAGSVLGAVVAVYAVRLANLTPGEVGATAVEQ